LNKWSQRILWNVNILDFYIKLHYIWLTLLSKAIYDKCKHHKDSNSEQQLELVTRPKVLLFFYLFSQGFHSQGTIETDAFSECGEDLQSFCCRCTWCYNWLLHVLNIYWCSIRITVCLVCFRYIGWDIRCIKVVKIGSYKH